MWLFKLKCRACGLHFMALSLDEDWHEQHNPFCPECGQNDGRFIIWREGRPGEFIFEHVPGLTETMVGLKL